MVWWFVKQFFHLLQKKGKISESNKGIVICRFDLNDHRYSLLIEIIKTYKT